MKQGISSVLVAFTILGVLLSLSSSVSALRCYECVSSESWSNCQSNARIQNCDSVSQQMSIMGRSVNVTSVARQIEPACVSVYARGSVGGVTGYAYVRQCFYNDKSLCNLLQEELPPEIRIVDCDLCTTELCNAASTATVAYTSILLLAVAMLWK